MNVSEEREQTLRGRFPRETNEIFGPPKYRTNSILVQVVFFILTCIGFGALYGFFAVLEIDGKGVIAGIIAIALAEYLMLSRRWFGTGVEAALWIGGLFMIVSELPSSGAPEARLVLGGAAALAGVRVRNPLFGAVAMMFVAEYAEKKFDAGVLCALLIATIAGFALLREWKRASTEWLWIAIVVLLPIYGRFDADDAWRTTTIALYAAFALLMGILAFARRHHALLVAAAIGAIIASAEVGQLLTTPLEAKLAFAGALLLGGSFVITRMLRERTTGVVVTAMQLTPVDDLLEGAGTVVAGHAGRHAGTVEPATSEARPAGEGHFGGAGASGDY